MECKVYYQSGMQKTVAGIPVKPDLHTLFVGKCYDAEDAILFAQELLEEEEIPFKKPLLAVIQGGNHEPAFG